MKSPHPSVEMPAILRAARELVARPGNDFTWTHWENAAQALSELDALLAGLDSGVQSQSLDLELLFAPTGPLQELSMSSGWSRECLELAARFDEALARS